MVGCLSALSIVPVDQFSAPAARMCLVKSEPVAEAVPSTEVQTVEVEVVLVAEVPVPKVQEETPKAHEEAPSAGEQVPIAQ
ncbi:uncharacterized protein N7473_011918 [Penicillium subrubescens]|nr:uncharacterized protein N7473_011918 [Penicillium subrubescens]KAJ5880865.1 hypothetical protein N7473_011918 [Penicillium subrubescens]